MNPVIVVTHAVFDEARRASMRRLREQLIENGLSFIVVEDLLQAGSLDCWRRAMNAGLQFGDLSGDASKEATHVVWLPDDAILCKGFGKALRAAIEARPDDVFDCVVNHHVVHDAEHNPDKANELPKMRLERGWYSTPEGYVGGAGVMPRALLQEHLEWRESSVGWAKRGTVGYLGNDTGVNVWAMATGRLIYKTARSLIDHDTSIPSLDGNDHHDFRRPLNFIADATYLGGWDDSPVQLGPTYTGQMWEPLWLSESWDPEWSYRALRGGAPVSAKPHVFIAMPAARAPEMAIRKSVERVTDNLIAHGIGVTYFESPGDSLVTRGRHHLVHEFMCSSATHLLQWDDDVECLDASSVRNMLASGYDVVGGAYPWRDGSGRVVANPLFDTIDPRTGSGHVDIDRDHRCIRVAEVGTGFLMTSRACIVDLMRKHPELLYQADIEPYVGAPMWALFDAFLEVRKDGRRRYASEDWRFCSLARAAGYPVYVYYPSVFRHWGKTAHEGHILKAWGMNPPKRDAKEAVE